MSHTKLIHACVPTCDPFTARLHVYHATGCLAVSRDHDAGLRNSHPVREDLAYPEIWRMTRWLREKQQLLHLILPIYQRTAAPPFFLIFYAF